MKIQSNNNTAMPELINVQRATNERDYAMTPQHADAIAADSSTVRLLSTSTLRASSATNIDLDLDIDKVASIKAALRGGTYSIDSGRVADGMLGLARDLLQ
ncbi:flagellar biosynthesis anti-sigma factor FlgM [Caballeronia grimmiae]|nr:flagellar biosynthesis anti-sigma factor FlgM [Caballeronia grimmiae]